MILFLAFSIAVFLFGLAGAFGASGTTALQPVTANAWKDFQTNYFGDIPGASLGKGHPYDWEPSAPIDHAGVVYFDKRLITMLKYLAQPRANAVCGWTGQHDYIQLSRDCPPIGCTSTPPSNAPSASTVSRGVGIMISQADYIKCEIESRDIQHPCPNQCGGLPAPFDRIGITFKRNEISDILDSVAKKSSLIPDLCIVKCAVDYYPNPQTCNVDEAERTKTQKAPDIQNANLDPSDPKGWFPYEDMNNQYSRAVAYKATQIGWELMTVDQKECAVDPGNNFAKRKTSNNEDAENVGNQRMIPYQIIFPAWIWGQMSEGGGDVGQKLLNLANTNFPNHYQQNSTLAGLAPYNPLLNDKGLHFNY